MLSMLEEVVLLTIDDRNGKLRATREFGTAYALVGALFFDLVLAGRIDTDTEEIYVIDQPKQPPQSDGNLSLDRVLAHMTQHPELKTVRDWIEEIYIERGDLEGETLQSLIDRGILRHENSKLLWIINVERFPLVSNEPQQHVNLRLAHAILSDEIPPTRDIMLVSIANACGLLGYVLSDSVLETRKTRIQWLSQMETISRKVTEAILELEQVARTALPQ